MERMLDVLITLTAVGAAGLAFWMYMEFAPKW